MAYQRDIITFTDFLNLNEQNILHTLPKDSLYTGYILFGGYASAERQMAAFIPDALSYEWTYPISCLEIRPLNEKFFEPLNHRDYLGAILNLGIERLKLGDLVVKEKSAYVFCSEKMSDFICRELNRIRHTSVICQMIPPGDFSFSPNTEMIRGTVASVRLDSVLALAFRTSRSSLVGLIESGKVFVNGKMIVSNGYTLKEKDVVSARGLGKFRYTGTAAQTKKGRIYVEIEKYI